jgi:hypothetical protein
MCTRRVINDDVTISTNRIRKPRTMTTKTIECTFKHSKETKGAHQYKEVTDKQPKATEGETKGARVEDYKIGSLYLRKTALEGDVPETIKATVEYQV